MEKLHPILSIASMALADQNDRIQYYGMYFTSRQSWHAGQDAPQVHVRGCAGVDVPYIQVGVHYTGPGVIIGTQIRNQCKSTRKSSIDTCDAPIKSSLSLLVHTVLLFLIFSFKKKL
jgi:hypothetical protein